MQSKEATSTSAVRFLYPDITSAATSEHAPIVKALQVLKDARLTRIHQYFLQQCTPPPQQRSVVTDIDSMDLDGEVLLAWVDELLEMHSDFNNTIEVRNSRIRLIGETVFKLTLLLPKLCNCLALPNDLCTVMDTKVEHKLKRTRIVCVAYAHLLRWLSSLYGQWLTDVRFDIVGAFFLGELFVQLVHRFALHKSENTFLFAQATPFILQELATTYQISEHF